MKHLSFAERLKQLREKAGMTAYALGVKAGLRAHQVYALEDADADPKVSTARKLADALGCSLDDLAPPRHRAS